MKKQGKIEYNTLQTETKLNSRLQTAFQKPVRPQFMHTTKIFHSEAIRRFWSPSKANDPSDTATRKGGCCAEPQIHPQEGIPWGSEGQRQSP